MGKRRRVVAGAMDGTAQHIMEHACEMEDRDLEEPSAPRAGARPSAGGEGDDQQAAFIEAHDLGVVGDGAVPAEVVAEA